MLGIAIVALPLVTVTLVPATTSPAAPPPPPAVVPAAVVVVLLIVTLVLELAEPPAVPETDKESVHEPLLGAVTDQLNELVVPPPTVPTDRSPEETVHCEEESVAVTPVADSVPEFCIVAETVNAPLAETDVWLGVREVMPSEAGAVTVRAPQSAWQVEPIRTQTSWEPVAVGVTTKLTVTGLPDV